MSLKVKISGTNRGVYPYTLKVKSKLNERSTADFNIRAAHDSGLSFEQGEPVIIYDDERTESVLVTKDKTKPYGPPGVMWKSADDGGQFGIVDCDVDDSNQPDGTLEFLFSVESGLSSIVAFEYDLIALVLAYVPYVYPFRFDLHYAAGELYPRLHTDTGDTDSVTPIVEGEVYRISIIWTYNVGPGNTTLTLRVDSVSAGSQTVAGYLFGADPCHVTFKWQWGISPAEQYFADCRFWDVVRTGGDIATDMFLRLVGTEADLRFYWKCDEGTGTVLDDLTANAFDGAFNEVDGLYPTWGATGDDWLNEYPLEDASEYQTLDYRHFSGNISSVKRVKLCPEEYEWRIACTDWSALPYRALVAPLSISDSHMQTIIRRAVLTHLPNELIGAYAMVEGPIIKSIKWTYLPMGKGFDQLRDMSHWAWVLDPYKEMRIIPPDGLSPAPFDIADTDDPKRYLQMDYDESRGKYFNRLVARVRVVEGGVQKSYFITAENLDEIEARKAIEGGDGIYEAFQDIAECGTKDQAIDVVIGAIEAASTRTIGVRYSTRQKGLRVGQSQHIQNAERDVDEDLLITEVSMWLEQGYDERYDVTTSQSISPVDFNSAIATALDSKSNFKDEIISWPLSAGGVRKADGVTLGDSVTVESGIE